MRSKAATGFGIGLAIVGVLCLIAAAVLVWVVVPNAKVLPADTDTTRNFTGTAKVLLNPQALAAGDTRNALATNVPVQAQRNVKVTATDGNTAQVSDSRTLVTATGQPVGGSDVSYAVDRETLGAATPPAGWDVTPHEGLTVTWPIGAEKKDYPAWVNETQTTTVARYVREEERGGRQTYVYEADVAAAPIKDEQTLAALPKALPLSAVTALASVLPLPDAVKAQMAQALPRLGDPIPLSYTYESTSTVWVDPTTGIVIDTERTEVRKAGIANGLLAVPVFDVSTAFTEASVTDAANEASDAAGVLEAAGTTVPIILLILGLLALIVGIVLMVMGMRRTPSSPPTSATYEGAP